MSIHRSLRVSDILAEKRNVLTRRERVEILRKKGIWSVGSSVYGLPKTKVAVLKAKKKVKKAEKEKTVEGAETKETAVETRDTKKEEK